MDHDTSASGNDEGAPDTHDLPPVQRIWVKFVITIFTTSLEGVLFHNRSEKYQRVVTVGLFLLCGALLVWGVVAMARAGIWTLLWTTPMALPIFIVFVGAVIMFLVLIAGALKLPGFRNVHRRNPRPAPVLRAVRPSRAIAAEPADRPGDTSERGGAA